MRTEPEISRQGNRNQIEQERSVHVSVVPDFASFCTEVKSVDAQNIESPCYQGQCSAYIAKPIAPFDDESFHYVAERKAFHQVI